MIVHSPVSHRVEVQSHHLASRVGPQVRGEVSAGGRPQQEIEVHRVGEFGRLAKTAPLKIKTLIEPLRRATEEFRINCGCGNRGHHLLVKPSRHLAGLPQHFGPLFPPSGGDPLQHMIKAGHAHPLSRRPVGAAEKGVPFRR